MDYESADLVDVFQYTFEINYTDVFGNMIVQDLLPPNGHSIPVTQLNKTVTTNALQAILFAHTICTELQMFVLFYDKTTPLEYSHRL